MSLIALGAGASLQADEELTGPYSHKNLQLFLIQGEETLKVQGILTLEEALEQKAVVVHETGNVNELKIENQSDQYVYVHPGDIVKGGKQDRTLPNGFTLKPKSEPVSIASFCVEHGRWKKRGSEDLDQFSGSSKVLNSKDLKLAARYSKSQSQVWDKVGVVQKKAAMNLGGSVQNDISASSLQLTLEDEKLTKAVQEYKDAITKELGTDKPDAIGFAVAINGEFISADVFGSRKLFAKLWPKLLDSMAAEAVTLLEKEKEFEPATQESVLAAMEEAASAEPATEKLAAKNRVVTLDGKDNVIFDAEAEIEGAKTRMHRAVLSKKGFEAVVPQPRGLNDIQIQRRSNVNNIPVLQMIQPAPNLDNVNDDAPVQQKEE